MGKTAGESLNECGAITYHDEGEYILPLIKRVLPPADALEDVVAQMSVARLSKDLEDALPKCISLALKTQYSFRKRGAVEDTDLLKALSTYVMEYIDDYLDYDFMQDTLHDMKSEGYTGATKMYMWHLILGVLISLIQANQEIAPRKKAKKKAKKEKRNGKK